MPCLQHAPFFWIGLETTQSQYNTLQNAFINPAELSNADFSQICFNKLSLPDFIENHTHEACESSKTKDTKSLIYERVHAEIFGSAKFCH